MAARAERPPLENASIEDIGEPNVVATNSYYNYLLIIVYERYLLIEDTSYLRARASEKFRLTQSGIPKTLIVVYLNR